tara:strand:- start:3505 stop:4947 length:1443 start_codon:yes stop_codon:yes gene_type:complete
MARNFLSDFVGGVSRASDQLPGAARNRLGFQRQDEQMEFQREQARLDDLFRKKEYEATESWRDHQIKHDNASQNIGAFNAQYTPLQDQLERLFTRNRMELENGVDNRATSDEIMRVQNAIKELSNFHFPINEHAGVEIISPKGAGQEETVMPGLMDEADVTMSGRPTDGASTATLDQDALLAQSYQDQKDMALLLAGVKTYKNDVIMGRITPQEGVDAIAATFTRYGKPAEMGDTLRELALNSFGVTAPKLNDDYISGLARLVHQSPHVLQDLGAKVREAVIVEMMKQNLLPRIPIKDSMLTAIVDFDSSLHELADLSGLVADRPDLFGPVKNWIYPYLIGTQTYEDWHTMSSKVGYVKQLVGKALEGGVLRKEDEEKYGRILAAMGDDPSVVESKIKMMLKSLKWKRDRFIHLAEISGRGLSAEDLETSDILPLDVDTASFDEMIFFVKEWPALGPEILERYPTEMKALQDSMRKREQN